MPGVLVRLENDAVIEQWRNAFDRVGFAVPRVGVQLEAAAPCFVPLGIEVDDQVEPTMPACPREIVEIHMRREPLPVQILMRATADVFRIVEEMLDACYRRNRLKKVGGLDIPVE